MTEEIDLLLLMTLHRYWPDGIGYWATNLGRSRTCISCLRIMHILDIWQKTAEYYVQQTETTHGDFGTVAEGFDTTETPQTVTVNNRDNEALVDRIFTTGSKCTCNRI